MRSIVLSFVFLPVLIFALKLDYDIPTFLEACYSKITSSNYRTDTDCLQKYFVKIFGTTGRTRIALLDQKALIWIESLGVDVHLHSVRRRRSTRLSTNRNRHRPTPLPKPRRRRIRKEIRTLTRAEREDFLSAINELKHDTSVIPNKYDAIALLHQNDAIASSHFGPNFLGWHRYYLYIFEEALRSKKPNCALPYWDSRLEFRMDSPEDSLLFSDLFMGNPTGVIVSGPFANWLTPGDGLNMNIPLRRGAPGPNSSLLNPHLLTEVWRQRYNWQIVHPTSVSLNANIERHHDGVHAWVGGNGGHMNGYITSTQDPIFFIFHCFIDYIWEIFRQRQRMNGIDPETDYPRMDITEHMPNRTMDNLTPAKQNIFGLSNFFTRYIYKYAPPPRCSNRCGGASDLYLFCNRKLYGCQARSRQEFADLDGFGRLGIAPFSEPFDARKTAGSPALDSVPHFPQGMVDERTMPGRS